MASDDEDDDDDDEQESCLRIVSDPMRTLIYSNAKCQCVPVRAAGVCAPCSVLTATYPHRDETMRKRKENVFRRRPEAKVATIPCRFTEIAFYLLELAMD